MVWHTLAFRKISMCLKWRSFACRGMRWHVVTTSEKGLKSPEPLVPPLRLLLPPRGVVKSFAANGIVGRDDGNRTNRPNPNLSIALSSTCVVNSGQLPEFVFGSKTDTLLSRSD